MRKRIRALIARLNPTGGVGEQSIKSGIWVTAANVTSRVLQLVLIVVLARLIGPAAIGLMGIALLGLSALQRFSQLGLNEALIQNRETNVDDYLDTTLTLQAARGLLLFGILFVSAPYIAEFLGEPQATNIIRVVGLRPVINGVQNPGVVYFQKDLDFHKQFVFRLSNSVTQFCVGIGFALVSPTVWALVFAFVAAETMQMLVSYHVHDYRPWPALNRSAAKELIGYGKWITGGAIVYFLYSEGDDAVVAWLLDASALGFYQLAYRMGNAPGTEVASVVRRVTFPAYSKLQDDTAALRQGFYQSFQVITAISFPMAVGIAVTAPTFVRAFLGSDWVPMITTMQILSGYGLLLSVTSPFDSVWKAVGRPDLSTKLGAFRVVLIALLIYPATIRFGIEGTAALVVGIYVFPLLPLDVHFLVDIIDSSYARMVRELGYPLGVSIVMGAAVWAVQRSLSIAPVLEFLVLVVTGAVVYVGVGGVLTRVSGWEMDKNLRTLVGTVRS